MVLGITKSVVLTRNASRDLKAIRRAIALDNPAKADSFVREIVRKIIWIAETNFTGSPRDEIAPGLRALPFRGRCIYFKTYETHVTIIRVLHGAQDVSSKRFTET